MMDIVPHRIEDGYGYVQPHDIEIERCVLGSAMGNKYALAIVVKILKLDDIYAYNHQAIYNAILNLYIDGHPVDTITVREQLVKSKEFENIGMNELMYISEMFAPSGHLEYYCHMIKNFSIKRQMISLANDLYKTALDTAVSGYDGLSSFIGECENTLGAATTIQKKSMRDTTLEMIKEIGVKPRTGLKSGFNQVDEATNGLMSGDLTVIAAGPSEGKSLFSLNIAKSVAKQGKGVMMFSLEMTQLEISERLLSDELNEPVSNIRNNKVDPNRLIEATEKMKDYDKNIHVHSAADGIHSIFDIISITKAEIERLNLGLVIIDYLQLVPTPDIKGKTRDQIIGELTRALKLMAVKENLPIIVLSQVNRDKSRKRYGLSDLRESGNIEQDANNVYFIYRPKKHNFDRFNFDGFDIDIDDSDAFLLIVKQRAGQLKDVRLKFKGDCSRFEDYQEPIFQVQENINPPF